MFRQARASVASARLSILAGSSVSRLARWPFKSCKGSQSKMVYSDRYVSWIGFVGIVIRSDGTH